ncbi:hypothetical protein LQ948_07040 [Jiella sp. MQZ9-1]|nr:hypothetical protein [Jiella flava]
MGNGGMALVAVTVAAIGLASLPAPAAAKPARCFTTGDGSYPCDFRATDADGSFEIRAKGKPGFSLLIDSKGVASGYADYGTGRNVPLPGRYLRQHDDPACWANTESHTKICAW